MITTTLIERQYRRSVLNQLALNIPLHHLLIKQFPKGKKLALLAAVVQLIHFGPFITGVSMIQRPVPVEAKGRWCSRGRSGRPLRGP